MLSLAVSESLWKRISARLWDLLALVLGTAISSTLLFWQQHSDIELSPDCLLGWLFFFPFAIIGYCLGIIAGALWQRIRLSRTGGDRFDRHHLHAAGVIQLWAWILLILLLFHIGWVLLPVAWSGLRCVQNTCESATSMPLHSSRMLSFETRDTLTIFLWLLIYGMVLPLGNSLALRLCLAPHWLGRQLTIFWIGCAVLLNIALIFTYPLVDWLGTWYE